MNKKYLAWAGILVLLATSNWFTYWVGNLYSQKTALEAQVAKLESKVNVLAQDKTTAQVLLQEAREPGKKSGPLR